MILGPLFSDAGFAWVDTTAASTRGRATKVLRQLAKAIQQMKQTSGAAMAASRAHDARANQWHLYRLGSLGGAGRRE